MFWPPHEQPVRAEMRKVSGNKSKLIGEKPQKEEEDPAIRAEREAEPFTMSEVRNDWTYHVRKDILKGYFETD